MKSWLDAFVARLRELGWIEGRTVAIEFDGRKDAANVSPKSQPNSFSSRWMSLPRLGPLCQFSSRQASVIPIVFAAFE